MKADFIIPNPPAWTGAEEIGYKPKTTFWDDFSMADKFGPEAVKDTYNRAFNEWKTDYIYLTELVLVLNHKSWQYVDDRPELSALYEELYFTADEYALDNLTGEDKQYYLATTD